MKKWSIFVLAVLTAASLAACGSGGEDQDRADSGDASQAQESAGAVSAEPSEETKVQELALGETTAVGVRETTITGFEFLEKETAANRASGLRMARSTPVSPLR